MTYKVVINDCYGGFSLSIEAIQLYAQKKGINLYCYERDPISSPIYKKVTKSQGGIHIIHVVTKDFGDTIDADDFNCDDCYFHTSDIPRHDKDLVSVVEELGESASTPVSKLIVKEIEGNQYYIDEYDGLESIVLPQSMKWVTINEGNN